MQVHHQIIFLFGMRLFFSLEESIYGLGVFQLQLAFPDDYPHRSAQVRFIAKVFHPNVCRC